MTSRLASVLLVAACGSAHHTVDGGRDSPHDTLPPQTADAPTGAVVLSVTMAGKPVPGVGAYFQNLDSSVVLGATTDANGTVGALVSAGGYVTAVEPDDGSGIPKLATFAGVQPGDMLHLDLDPAVPPAGADTVLTVATYSGASSYQVYSPCGMVVVDTTGTSAVGFQGCANVVDLLVVAVDDNSTPLQAYFKPSVTIGPAPTDAIGYSADAASGASYAALDSTHFDYGDVPNPIVWVKTTQELWSSTGRLYDATTGAAPSAMSVHTTIDQPAASGLLAVTVTDVTPDSSPIANQHGEQLIYDWDAWSASYSVSNLAQALLAPYATDPVYSFDTKQITWTETAGITPDFVRARILVYRDAIPTGTAWQWSIIAPRLASPKIAFPQLPVEGFDYNPMMTDTISVSDLTNVRAPGGYDGYRAHGFTDFARYAGALGGTGRIVIEIPFSQQL